MFVRAVAAVAAVSFVAAAAPALARPVAKSHLARSHGVKTAASRPVDPARVLAGTSRDFADRTASMSSIMGSDSMPVARMVIPLRPEHPPRDLRREADATAGLR